MHSTPETTTTIPATKIAQLLTSSSSTMADSTPAIAVSPLQQARLQYAPKINPLLSDPLAVQLSDGEPTKAAFDAETIAKLFPNLFGQPVVNFAQGTVTPAQGARRVGVVLSGGPAPGGHNVICGMYDFLAEYSPESELIGFLSGPDGLLKCEYKVLDAAAVAPFRNQGGFHMIGSGRTKVESDEQFAAARDTVTKLSMDALVVIGGDDSNSNAMKLAENFRANGVKCGVNGAPKTIDNDLRNEQVEVSFGFDTAVKSYAESVGSLAFDAVSARKAYHFIRVMGRSASHIALECALQTRPNLCFIGEEVQQRGMTLPNIVSQIVDVVVERAALGKNYGVVVLPEGLVEFMPDVEALISDLNEMLAHAEGEMSKEEVAMKLKPANAELLNMLPDSFANQLMLERDPHGNVQVAKIEAERLLIDMVSAALKDKKKDGIFKGKFSGVPHYMGYEARCAMPSNFDANYTYGLGRVAAALCVAGKSGYIAALSGLTKSAEEWEPAGYPLTMMMNIERRHGKDVAVIKKKLVDLEGAPFNAFASSRGAWRLSDDYRTPGSAQFWGPAADDVTLSLALDAAGKA